MNSGGMLAVSTWQQHDGVVCGDGHLDGKIHAGWANAGAADLLGRHVGGRDATLGCRIGDVYVTLLKPECDEQGPAAMSA